MNMKRKFFLFTLLLILISVLYNSALAQQSNFENSFNKQNNIDSALQNDLKNPANFSTMMTVQTINKYSKMWEDQIIAYYRLLQEKLPVNNFQIIKKEQEEWEKAQPAYFEGLKKEYLSLEGQQKHGSIGRMDIAHIRYNYFKDRAKALYRYVYDYGLSPVGNNHQTIINDYSVIINSLPRLGEKATTLPGFVLLDYDNKPRYNRFSGTYNNIKIIAVMYNETVCQLRIIPPTDLSKETVKEIALILKNKYGPYTARDDGYCVWYTWENNGQQLLIGGSYEKVPAGSVYGSTTDLKNVPEELSRNYSIKNPQK